MVGDCRISISPSKSTLNPINQSIIESTNLWCIFRDFIHASKSGDRSMAKLLGEFVYKNFVVISYLLINQLIYMVNLPVSLSGLLPGYRLSQP